MGLLVTCVAACGLAAAQRVAGPGELNHNFLDPYSLVHVLVGVVIALFGLGFAPAMAIAVAWEVVEHVAKNLAPAAFPHPTQDTLANSAGDVLSTAIGWIITAAMRSRQPPRESGSSPVSFLRWRLRLPGARRRR